MNELVSWLWIEAEVCLCFVSYPVVFPGSALAPVALCLLAIIVASIWLEVAPTPAPPPWFFLSLLTSNESGLMDIFSPVGSLMKSILSWVLVWVLVPVLVPFCLVVDYQAIYWLIIRDWNSLTSSSTSGSSLYSWISTSKSPIQPNNGKNPSFKFEFYFKRSYLI